jgi:AcrR family transcriptional regulator
MASTKNESSFNNVGSKSRPRPGGRTADVSNRIHRAIVELLEEGGHEACTYPRIADKAGIERSTLYRRYPDRWAMLGEAYVATLASELNVTPTGDFREDLKSHLRKVGATLSSPLGTAMVAAGAIARIDPESLISAGRYWQSRLQDIEPFIAAAIERGELEADLDREALIGSSEGPLYFRLLIVGKPIDEELIQRTVENTCKLYCKED